MWIMLSSGPKSTKSRFHIFKTAPTGTLLIADSQARHLKAGNLNIISLPGAKARDVYNFIPPKNEFDLIILFVGGNDLFDYTEPSYTPAPQIANEIIALANFLSERAKQVFVLEIPERDRVVITVILMDAVFYHVISIQSDWIDETARDIT